MSFTYEVRLRGHLSSALRSQFEQLDLVAESEPVGGTLLHGPVEDQAALHGLLRRIESLGLELIELRRLPEDGPAAPVPPAPSAPSPSP